MTRHGCVHSRATPRAGGSGGPQSLTRSTDQLTGLNLHSTAPSKTASSSRTGAASGGKVLASQAKDNVSRPVATVKTTDTACLLHMTMQQAENVEAIISAWVPWCANHKNCHGAGTLGHWLGHQSLRQHVEGVQDSQSVRRWQIDDTTS